jgi:hypothetical protein
MLNKKNIFLIMTIAACIACGVLEFFALQRSRLMSRQTYS